MLRLYDDRALIPNEKGCRGVFANQVHTDRVIWCITHKYEVIADHRYKTDNIVKIEKSHQGFYTGSEHRPTSSPRLLSGFSLTLPHFTRRNRYTITRAAERDFTPLIH